MRRRVPRFVIVDGCAVPRGMALAVGRQLLSDWRCGMDWANSGQALNAAGRIGVKARRPYADGREVHHLNFRRRPRLSRKERRRAWRLIVSEDWAQLPRS